MRNYKLLAGLLFAGLLAACAPEPSVSVESDSKFDAELAEELGADAYGMRPYVFVILKTGPQDAIITNEEERGELFAGHFSNMGRLAEEGKLVLAGPLSDPEGIMRGIYIFNVATVEEAAELVVTDPAIAAGIFEVEMVPYYGSAALMKINEIHEQIQRTSM